MQRCIKCKIDKDRCDCEQEQKDILAELINERVQLIKKLERLDRQIIRERKERGQIL